MSLKKKSIVKTELSDDCLHCLTVIGRVLIWTPLIIGIPGFLYTVVTGENIGPVNNGGGAEGPERLIITGHLQGQVAFNSWGQEDFWAREVRLSGSDNSYRYGPEDVMSQIPEGGAYVALVLESGPPGFETEPPEYKQSDLSGLIRPHDWRQDSVTEAQFMPFNKWGQDLELVVACHPDASDETVDQLNKLLQSWKFDDYHPVDDQE